MEGYDSGDDIFITQNTFCEENIDMQAAVDAVDSLLEFCDSSENNVCTGGEVLQYVDFLNRPENVPVDILEDLFVDEMSGDFPDVSQFHLKDNFIQVVV